MQKQSFNEVLFLFYLIVSEMLLFDINKISSIRNLCGLYTLNQLDKMMNFCQFLCEKLNNIYCHPLVVFTTFSDVSI